MKKSDVQIGVTYLVKVAGNLVPVKITRQHDNGGWEGTSIKTGKTIRIKSAQRLRKRLTEVVDDEADNTAAALATQAHDATEPTQHATVTAERNTGEPFPPEVPEAPEAPNLAETPDPLQPAATVGQCKPKRTSLLDAAAQVLAQGDEPLSTKQIVTQAIERKLWTPGAGKTPEATLYAAIAREIKNKGDLSRFVKVERGKFTLAPGSTPV